MGLLASCPGEAGSPSASAGLASFPFSVDPEATSGAVAASMLGGPEAGLQREIFTVGGEGGAKHLLSSLASGVPATGLCNWPGLFPPGYFQQKGCRGWGREADQTAAQNSRGRTEVALLYPGREATPLTQPWGVGEV